jgi:hypothetical protein
MPKHLEAVSISSMTQRREGKAGSARLDPPAARAINKTMGQHKGTDAARRMLASSEPNVPYLLRDVL